MNIERLNNLTDYIPEVVKEFLVEVAENNKNVDVYLGGGYLRDIAVGKQPKDIDIFLAPREGWCGIEYIPQETMVMYRKTSANESIKADLEARNLQILTGLFCAKLSPVKDVQYITYKNTMSLSQVAEDFDMGICQITYNPLTDELHYTENFVKGHTEKVIECFHTYDVARTHARFERMESKFPDYGVVGKPDYKKPVVLRSSGRSGTKHSDSV